MGTLYYPIFFNQFAGRGSATSTHFAVAVLLSTVLVAFLAPLLGAYADSRGRRNTLFKLVGFASIIGTWFFARNRADWRRAGDCDLCGIPTSHSCKHTNFYDSYISLLGSIDQTIAGQSGAGWGLGYLGGLLPFAVTLAVLDFRVPTDRERLRIVFVRGCVILRRILFVRIRQSAKRHAGNKSVLDVSDRVQNAPRMAETPHLLSLPCREYSHRRRNDDGSLFMSVYATETLKLPSAR